MCISVLNYWRSTTRKRKCLCQRRGLQEPKHWLTLVIPYRLWKSFASVNRNLCSLTQPVTMNEVVCKACDAVLLKMSWVFARCDWATLGVPLEAGHEWTEGVVLSRPGFACVESSGLRLASRHSAVSRKAAQNQTMPLYGNNWMQCTSFCLVRNAGQGRHPVAALRNYYDD